MFQAAPLGGRLSSRTRRPSVISRPLLFSRINITWMERRTTAHVKCIPRFGGRLGCLFSKLCYRSAVENLQKFFKKTDPFSEGQEIVFSFKAWFKATGLISEYSLHVFSRVLNEVLGSWPAHLVSPSPKFMVINASYVSYSFHYVTLICFNI